MEPKYMSFHGATLRTINFTATIFKEGQVYVAHSPELDVSSMGSDQEMAKKNLLDAVRGFLMTAASQGTLEQILEEAGFVQKDRQTLVPPEHVATDRMSLQV